METTQHIIHKKIGAIEIGLLRCEYEGEKISMPVKIDIDDDNMLNCVVVMGEFPADTLLHKNVTIVQRDSNNYLYIGGRICREVKNETLVLSMDITKACWYTRMSTGSVRWLQEKHVYLPLAS